MATLLDSREAALLILKYILDEGQTSSRAMENFSSRIHENDRGFVRNLVTTTLRRLGQIDRMIDHLTTKKLSKPQMMVRHTLRLGVTQLLFMDVATYAAVDKTVNLMDIRVDKKLKYLKNTVNAVLRNVDRDREMLLKKFGNTRLNFPGWLLKRWDAHYGAATVKDMIAECLNEAPLDISLKNVKMAEEWAEKLGGEVGPTGSIRVERAGKITELVGYSDGEWWVQDAAARIPEILLGVSSGDKILDLCAAPGGKTAQSASRGALVTAVDLSEGRIKRLKQNMNRLALEVNVVTSDVLEYKNIADFDYILLDAPCSSTGTIRRHPELLHQKRVSEIVEVAKVQSEMLDYISSSMKSGATLVYAVCSLEKEEGEDQIKALLERDASLKRKEIAEQEIPSLECTVLETGDVRTLPHYIKGGMDGFFVSRLVKR
ncbi:RsmB/NOP family class I SAM-dependent RNA methyltransferase [Pseudemcibacter aquimaris]|uniref:RsmB/NOP family class I SAM-dependent RNA methyltransferase n=1 Tax=Pseudemcibacter aquimaris TaxID=2857064 RepID=UPI0020136B19|nr:transcription antitermination factor NusB [Pseudemcibacter aquimaris]MCC3861849.1 RsmD family RNA methyltransferase [Pseudemcibacter aquimaris]WDU58602.1 RsmD family RNA methyltransferase [Pseudemcibacter aquimaris]